MRLYIYTFDKSVSYRLEDLKSGTVKVRSLFIYFLGYFKSIQKPITFLRNGNIFTW